MSIDITKATRRDGGSISWGPYQESDGWRYGYRTIGGDFASTWADRNGMVSQAGPSGMDLVMPGPSVMWSMFTDAGAAWSTDRKRSSTHVIQMLSDGTVTVTKL